MFFFAGEGLAGAQFWKSFTDLSKEIGFSGPYLLTSRSIVSGNDKLTKFLGRMTNNFFC